MRDVGFGASFIPSKMLDIVGIADSEPEPAAPEYKPFPDEFWRFKRRLEAPLEPDELFLAYQAVQARLQRPHWMLAFTDDQLKDERAQQLAQMKAAGLPNTGHWRVESEATWLRRARKFRAQHAYLVAALAKLEEFLSGKAA